MRIHPVFHASMLQCCNQSIPLQTVKTPVEPNEEYQVENILEQRMISGKPTISSSEKDTIPQKTHGSPKRTYSTVRGRYNSLRKGPGSIKKLELIDSSKESRLEGSEEFSSSPVPLLSLLSSEATQRTLATAQDSFCFKVLKRRRTFASSLKGAQPAPHAHS
jgi:hypothetical protein